MTICTKNYKRFILKNFSNLAISLLYSKRHKNITHIIKLDLLLPPVMPPKRSEPLTRAYNFNPKPFQWYIF